MSESTSDSGPLAPTFSALTDEQLAETPIRGAIPRFELREWRTTFRVSAGITARGEKHDPIDFTVGSEPMSDRVRQRWQALHTELGADGVVVAHQIHGARAGWHGMRRGLTILDGLDGHGTSDPGLLLAVTVADCIPTYLLDPVTRSIALVHAGWKGIADGVLASGIELLRERAGSRVENLLMYCGPGVCGSCYEVGSEVMDALAVPHDGPGPWLLDLRRELMARAWAMGLARVSASPMCTIHSRGAFFSHRASGGTDGRMVAYLGLMP